MLVTLLMLMKKKTLEAVIANSVLISAPDNYKEVNLHLAETIDSTIDQFKALIEKARKFAEIMTLQSNNSTFQF